MPAAAPIVLSAAAAALPAAAISIKAALITFVVTAAAGFASMLLTPSAEAFKAGARTVNLREPVTARRLIYGEVIVGGSLALAETRNSNQELYMTHVLGEGEIEGVSTTYVNEKPINPESLDANGATTEGKFWKAPGGSGQGPQVWIRPHEGADGQAADSFLQSNLGLPASWRGRGVAYVAVRLNAQDDIFRTGIPRLRWRVFGRKLFDPRDGGTRWSPNPALCVYDYLTDTKVGLGVPAAEIDAASVSAAANVCDEIVNTRNEDPEEHVTQKIDSAGNQALRLDRRLAKLQTGDRFKITGNGTPPTPLVKGTNYFAIVRNEQRSKNKNGSVLRPVKIRVAATYADALAGVHIGLTGGSEVLPLKVKKTGEPRYTCNGVISSSATPRVNLDHLLSAMRGKLVWTGGLWTLHADGEVAASVAFDGDDLRGPIKIQTRHTRRTRFNGVKGLYAGLQQQGEPTDYPPVVDEDAVADDEPVLGKTAPPTYQDVNYPMTSRPQTAQRLAKIELKRHRAEIAFAAPMKLTGLLAKPGDVVSWTLPRQGWVAKAFEVVAWNLAPDTSGGDGAPYLGCDLVFREHPGTPGFAFDPDSEEVLVAPTEDSAVPDPTIVGIPGAPQVAEVLYQGRAGGGVKAKAVVSWTASADGFVTGYNLETKPTAETDWHPASTATIITLEAEVLDLAPGLHDFRLQAVNSFGAASDWVETLGVDLQGLSAAPAAPQGLTVAAISSMALLRWTRPAELDVRIGGRIVFRHTPLQSGAKWEDATTIGEPVTGDQTLAVLPLKPGTYLAKAIDAIGTRSATAAQVSTKGATVLAFANLGTLTEHPGFAGAHSGTVGVDGLLKLEGAALFDSIADFDAVADLDTLGGIAASGTYDFAAGLDLGSVKKARVSSNLQALSVNVTDLVDERTSNIDDWEDFDNVDSSIHVDAQVWFRETDDDPNGSPTWLPWQRLDVTEVEARGLDFQARLESADITYNVEVSQLSVTAEEIAP